MDGSQINFLGFFLDSTEHDLSRMRDQHEYRTSKVVLTGPPRSGKTTLAFHYACRRAFAVHQPILYIATRTKLYQSSPQIPPDYYHDDEFLDMIHIKYVDNEKELLEYVSSLQSFQPPPSMIVVDDFGSYFSSSNTPSPQRHATLTRVFGILSATVDHWTCKRHEQGSPACLLLLTDTTSTEGNLMNTTINTYQHWIPVVLHIDASPSHLHISQRTLRVSHCHRLTEDPYHFQAQFSIGITGITLERFESIHVQGGKNIQAMRDSKLGEAMTSVEKLEDDQRADIVVDKERGLLDQAMFEDDCE